MVPCGQAPTAEQVCFCPFAFFFFAHARLSNGSLTPVSAFLVASAQATEVAQEILASYYAGEIDRIELLYTSFISMIASIPTVRTLVPLLPSGMEMEGDEIFKLTSKEGDIAVEKETIPVAEPQEFAPDMIFEQEPSQLLNAILPLYLNGQLLRTLQERSCSEITLRQLVSDFVLGPLEQDPASIP